MSASDSVRRKGDSCAVDHGCFTSITPFAVRQHCYGSGCVDASGPSGFAEILEFADPPEAWQKFVLYDQLHQRIYYYSSIAAAEAGWGLLWGAETQLDFVDDEPLRLLEILRNPSMVDGCICCLCCKKTAPWFYPSDLN